MNATDRFQERIDELEVANRQLREENARHRQAEAQAQHRLQAATLLHRISTHIALAEDMVAALQSVCTELAHFLGVPQAGFALLSPDGSTAEVVADFHPPDSPSAIGAEIPVAGNPSMAYLLDHGAPLTVRDAQKDPLLAPVHEIMRQRNVASILIVPIIADSGVIGTLGFDTFERRVFSQSDIDLVQHVANQAGQVLLRKRIEEALQASEEAIRALLNATTDVLMLTDIDGVILEANETAARRFDVCLEEFVGSCIWDLLPPDVARQRMAHADEILQSGKPGRFEDWRSGMWFDNAVHPVVDVQGTITRLAVFARDITERKLMEEALKDSEGRLSSLLSAMVDSVFALDEEGRFTFYHAPHTEDLYLPPLEFMGQLFTEVLPPHMHELLTEALSENRSGQVAEYEYEIELGSKLRWFSTKLSPVFVDGEFQGSVAVAREITERKKMEGLLRHSLEETAHDQQILLALSQATREVQRAKTPEEIYRTIGEGIASLGYDAAVFALTADQTHLIPVHMTYDPGDLQAAAEITGFTPQKHQLMVVPGGLVEQLIAERRAVFSSEPDQYIAQVLSASVEPSLKQLISSMGVKRVIHAPLVIGDDIHGLLVVTGPDLREADTQAVSVFASQTAIALANVRLFQETRTWADELERRVAERTGELASANMELETALARRKQVEEAVRHSRTETLRSHRLLLALSQAAEQVQRARTPEEVYQTIGDEVARLGYCVIFLALTDEQTHLFLSYLTVQLATLQAAERLSAGLPAQGLQIPFSQGDPFHKIITRNESAFFERTAEHLTRSFPKLSRRLLDQMVAVWGTERSIYSPLSINGKPHGLLAVTGPDLTEADLPTVTLFANRAASAIENAQLVEQLTTGRQKLQQLARQLVSAQEDERQRLSRALHDEAGQALTALKISLNLIGEDLPDNDASLHQRIKDATALTDTTMERIRLLAQGLRPPALDAVGLNHTLESLCQDFGDRIQLPIEYHGLELPWLSGPINIILYRFVQEALTNVAKHASAERVSVVLYHDTQTLWLSVEDDGQGFDPRSRATDPGYSTGIGLLGMQERLESLGGRLEIESLPGQGSHLVAHIPLQEE